MSNWVKLLPATGKTPSTAMGLPCGSVKLTTLSGVKLLTSIGLSKVTRYELTGAGPVRTPTPNWRSSSSTPVKKSSEEAQTDVISAFGRDRDIVSSCPG